MGVELHEGRQALSLDITRVERSLGETLPASFSAFVAEYDGAVPGTNIFRIGTGQESGVSKFIPVREILSARRWIENLPPKAFPVAWAEGGNYVYVDCVSGAVFFWDHELPEQSSCIASDFAALIEMIEPFDPASVKLQPGQVLSAWIDPDFLANLKE